MLDAHEIQAHNVGNRVSSLWAVVSEPWEAPDDAEWEDEFACMVHGVFDDMDAANAYVYELAKGEVGNRSYCAMKVEPLDRATYERQ